LLQGRLTYVLLKFNNDGAMRIDIVSVMGIRFQHHCFSNYVSEMFWTLVSAVFGRRSGRFEALSFDKKIKFRFHESTGFVG